MKNFYDLQDISTTIDVVLELEVIDTNGEPTVEIFLNESKLYEKCPLNGFRRFYTSLKLMDTAKLEISMSNKQYNAEKETAIIIKSLKIDNIEIIPTYNHLVDYQNDHNKNITTNYLGYNGKWTLHIDRPFYQWYHQVSSQGWILTP